MRNHITKFFLSPRPSLSVSKDFSIKLKLVLSVTFSRQKDGKRIKTITVINNSAAMGLTIQQAPGIFLLHQKAGAEHTGMCM